MKKLAINIVFLFSAYCLYAQQRANSPLSRFGYGDIQDKNYALGDGLSGAVTGLRDPLHLNVANPASLTAMDSMSFIFEVGLSSTSTVLSLGDQERDAHNAGIDYVGFAFPILDRWKVGGGVKSFSFNGYSFTSTDTGTPTGDTVFYQVDGNGGLSEVYLSNAIGSFYGVSLGLNSSYVFGYSENQSVINFYQNRSRSVIDKSDIVRTRGFIFALAMQYEKEFSIRKRLSFGATFQPKQTLQYYTYRQVTSTDVDMEDLESDWDKTEVPASFAIGVAFQNREQIILSADFETTAWKNVEIYGEKDLFNNYQRVSAGVEWLPEKYSLHYLKRVRYRLGGKMENMHWKDGDTGYAGVSLSGGIGLPFKQTKNTLNLHAEVGRHIAANPDALSDRYLTIKANITLFDKWFYKRKID